MRPVIALTATARSAFAVAFAAMLLASVSAQEPSRSGPIRNRTLEVPGVGGVTYGIAVPRTEPSAPVPLVLALHPGGAQMAYYGSRFMSQIVMPALGDWGAVMVAPDAPGRSWVNPGADRAVMALLEKVRQEHRIDPTRILVVGYSMGGRGTWFMASHHADLFTAAIPMAASVGEEPIDQLGLMPTYIIHSRSDELMPFAPAERNARQLLDLGRPVRFEPLTGFGHFDMAGYIEPLRRAGQWIQEQWAR